MPNYYCKHLFIDNSIFYEITYREISFYESLINYFVGVVHIKYVFER